MFVQENKFPYIQIFWEKPKLSIKKNSKDNYF